MIQNPVYDATRYIVCPGCGKGPKQVSHLEVGAKTAWYCDECGVRFRLHVLSADAVDCEVIPGERKEKTIVTLRSEVPVTIRVEGMNLINRENFDDDGTTPELRDRYFYEEHTCPTNFLGVLNVSDDAGDTDPHGIFKYVKTEPWVEPEESQSDDLPILLLRALGGGADDSHQRNGRRRPPRPAAGGQGCAYGSPQGPRRYISEWPRPPR